VLVSRAWLALEILKHLLTERIGFYYSGKFEDDHKLTNGPESGEMRIVKDHLDRATDDIEKKRIFIDYLERHYLDTWEVKRSSEYTDTFALSVQMMKMTMVNVFLSTG